MYKQPKHEIIDAAIDAAMAEAATDHIADAGKMIAAPASDGVKHG